MLYDDKVLTRMKKIEGQLRGVMRMIEEGQDCKAVITQLRAVRAAVDRTIGVVVTDNLVTCLGDNEASDEHKSALVKQAVDLLVKSR